MTEIYSSYWRAAAPTNLNDYTQVRIYRIVRATGNIFRCILKNYITGKYMLIRRRFKSSLSAKRYVAKHWGLISDEEKTTGSHSVNSILYKSIVDRNQIKVSKWHAAASRDGGDPRRRMSNNACSTPYESQYYLAEYEHTHEVDAEYGIDALYHSYWANHYSRKHLKRDQLQVPSW